MSSVFSPWSACRTGAFAQRSRVLLQIYKIADCCRPEVASDVYLQRLSRYWLFKFKCTDFDHTNNLKHI